MRESGALGTAAAQQGGHEGKTKDGWSGGFRNEGDTPRLVDGEDTSEVASAEGLTKTKAFVVLKSGQSVSEAELKAFVKDRLAPYKYPRFIEFIAELPKTATGKIQRFKLRDSEAKR